MKSIHVVADTLPMAWEQAVLRCWNEGDEFSTQYDKEGDPPSKDVAALIHVKDPFAEPRIHRAFPGGLNDLEKYRSEVLYGVHDHWCDPDAGKWEYTYHERLFDYDGIDQIGKVIDMLKECGFTRRAQAITWKPADDLYCSDPPCLQKM